MRKWLPLVTVCLGTFMLLIDVTIVNVALPDMAADLSTSFGSLQWVVDAYALALAALVLGTGSIADLIGHRRAYVIGLVLFAASSLVCGLAPNAGSLVAARFVQGIGAAAMFATAFPLLNSNYQGRDRGTAYGMWGAVAGASAAVGPIVGGLLTEGVSWRWIFFVNLPVSVLAVLLCARVADAHPPVRRRVDLAGIVVFTAAAASLTYGLIRANDHGWSTVGSWAWLVAAPVLLAVFVAVELTVSQPMFELSLLRSRSFVGVLAAGLVLSLAAFSALTYVSIWLQSVLGLSPIEAGLTGLPLSIASFVVPAALGRVLHGMRPGPVIGWGVVLIGVGAAMLGLLLHGSASWPALIPGYALIGVGVGMATPILGSAAMSAVEVQRGGMAAGALNTMRQLGFAFGIAALGSVFAARASSVLSQHGVAAPDGVARALAGGQARQLVAARPQLAGALHAAAVSGVQLAWLVAGAVGVVVGLVVLALMRTPRRVDEPTGATAQAVPA